MISNYRTEPITCEYGSNCKNSLTSLKDATISGV